MNREEQIKSIRKIDLNKVIQVYNGLAGACMCGCVGDYAVQPGKEDIVAKDRGYAVNSDEISERKVRIRIKKILNNLENADEVYVCDDYFGIDLGSRTTIAYLETH